jgi:hypothetical protein
MWCESNCYCWTCGRIPQDTLLKENNTNYNEELMKKVSENVTRIHLKCRRGLFLTLLPLLHTGKMEYSTLSSNNYFSNFSMKSLKAVLEESVIYKNILNKTVTRQDHWDQISPFCYILKHKPGKTRPHSLNRIANLVGHWHKQMLDTLGKNSTY